MPSKRNTCQKLLVALLSWICHGISHFCHPSLHSLAEFSMAPFFHLNSLYSPHCSLKPTYSAHPRCGIWWSHGPAWTFRRSGEPRRGIGSKGSAQGAYGITLTQTFQCNIWTWRRPNNYCCRHQLLKTLTAGVSWLRLVFSVKTCVQGVFAEHSFFEDNTSQCYCWKELIFPLFRNKCPIF